MRAWTGLPDSDRVQIVLKSLSQHDLGTLSPMGNRSFDRSARDRGLRSVSFLTRITVAASVGLTAAFSAVAAIAFSGHSTTTGKTPTTAAPAGGQLVALPPRNGGSLNFPQPPIGPPVGAGGGGQTTSGGS